MPRQIASTYRGDDGEAVNFICIITIKIENNILPHPSSDKKRKQFAFGEKIKMSFIMPKSLKAMCLTKNIKPIMMRLEPLQNIFVHALRT